MSLTQNSFEEAKKKASKRISEWVNETKTAGIVRLQDRYSQTFKSIEWKPKTEKTKIIDTRKITKENTASKKKTTKDKKGKEKLNDGKCGKNDSTEKKEMERNSKSKTPVPERNTESRADRITESRTERNTPSRIDRNTDSRASRASRTSRKLYRDSANILYGDNRNNRSSLFSSREQRSRSSIDAISLLFDGESETIENEMQKENKFNQLKKKTEVDTYMSKIQLESKQDGKNTQSKQLSGLHKNKRDANRQTLNFPGYRRVKKKKGKKYKNNKDSPEDVIIGPDILPTIEVDIHSGTLHLQPNTTIRQAVSSIQVRSRSRLNAKSRADLIRPPSQLLPRASSRLLSRESHIKITRSATTKIFAVRSFSNLRRKKMQKEKSDIKVYADPEARKEYVRTKFKKLVRKLINIQILLKGSQLKIRKEMGSFHWERKKSKADVRMVFDPAQFKAASNTYGGITKRAKQALWKQPQQRTEDDIGVLMEVMYRLPFFTKYAMRIKRDLAKVLWYDHFETGRTIIKQDDPGSRMYFLISGTISLHMTETDARTGTKNIRHLRDVCAGSMFGELALIRNIKRTYTAICKEESELLSLSKDEFNLVLRKRWEEDWKARLNFMKESEHFKDWSEEKIINCADHSELREYSDNKVIFGDETSLTNEVFFIRKGKALMVKKITFVRNKSPYLRPALFLPGMKGANTKRFMDKSYGKQMRSTRQEKHLVTIMTLLPDNYFGVGEDLTDTYVISKGKTECIIINSASYSINNKMDELKELSNTRQSELPSNRELYHRFEINRRWIEYRKSLVQDILKRRNKPHSTTQEDIPTSFLLEPGIPNDLIL